MNSILVTNFLETRPNRPLEQSVEGYFYSENASVVIKPTANFTNWPALIALFNGSYRRNLIHHKGTMVSRTVQPKVKTIFFEIH